MRNSEKEIQYAQIRAALRNAEAKGQMSVVSAITGISKKALIEILDGEFDIPEQQRIVLMVHLQ